MRELNKNTSVANCFLFACADQTGALADRSRLIAARLRIVDAFFGVNAADQRAHRTRALLSAAIRDVSRLVRMFRVLAHAPRRNKW